MAKHSLKYAPSKAGTWINCALSTLLNQNTSNETNEAAEFGSQCHELGAALICKSLKLFDYDESPKDVEELKKELPLYTPEMLEIAEGYANFVISRVEYERKKISKDPFVVVEQYLDMDFDDDAGGTLDLGIISNSSDDSTLTVIDLKTGRVPVYAFNEETKNFNYQLGLYALYFYKTYCDLFPNINKVQLVIYQPVINNTNEYEMPLNELFEFEKNVLVPAVEKTRVENPKAKPGNYCKYCAGKALCVKRKDEALSVVETKKEVQLLTDSEIEQILPHLDEIIQYCTDLKEFCLKKAMNGFKWSNFKLVHAKATRKIIDEQAVISVYEKEGIDPYSDRKLAGITELTKKLGKDKFKELITPYLVVQEGSVALVPESDPREEILVCKEEK